MTMRRLFTLALLLGLLTTAAATAAAPHRTIAAPLAGPCTPGAAYDPACDANQDGHITITDIQLTAGHWNQNGAFVSDNNHTHLGQTWTGSNNPLKIQGAFGAPDYAPLVLSNSAGHGLSIPTTSIDGIYVGSAGAYGMVVNAAVQDGIYVGATGSPSSSQASPLSNGFEVAGAQGDGLYVGRADNNGVTVNSAASQGVLVGLAGGNGVSVNSAVYNGMYAGLAGVNGVLVASAGFDGMYANTTQPSGQWGFETPDGIHGSNVLLHSLSLVAQVSGPDGLTPGDIVAVAGVTDPVPGSTVHTPLVRLAGGTFANVVGVVESRLALIQQPSHAQTAEGAARAETPVSELRSVEGPAQAGDYVALTVLGAAQVKVDSATPIEIGQRLTIGVHGRARPLGTIKVQLAGGAGTADLLESAPVIGVAMEPAKGSMVWVLVNPQ